MSYLTWPLFFVSLPFDSIYGGCAIKAELNYSKAMEYYQKSYHYASLTMSPGNRLGVLMDIIYLFYIRSDR